MASCWGEEAAKVDEEKGNWLGASWMRSGRKRPSPRTVGQSESAQSSGRLLSSEKLGAARIYGYHGNTRFPRLCEQIDYHSESHIV